MREKKKDIIEKALFLPFGVSEEEYEKAKKEWIDRRVKQGVPLEKAEEEWYEKVDEEVKKAANDMLKRLSAKMKEEKTKKRRWFRKK